MTGTTAVAAATMSILMLLLARTVSGCSVPPQIDKPGDTNQYCQDVTNKKKPPQLNSGGVQPPWPQPPQGVGCYIDQDPHATGGQKGKRQLECGVPGCSGQYGCGGKQASCPAADCPAWPPSVAACNSKSMTIENCVTNCLTWSQKFVYAGVANGDECWCGHTLGKGSGSCVHNTCRYCEPKYVCTGNQKQNCGGSWAVNVYQIRPDEEKELNTGLEVSEALLFLLLVPVYVVGGAIIGHRKGAGGAAEGSSAKKSRPSLRTHVHYEQWAALRGLCMDGLVFTLAKLGVRHTRRRGRVGGDEGASDKRGSIASVQSGRSAKSGKSGRSTKSDKSAKSAKSSRSKSKASKRKDKAKQQRETGTLSVPLSNDNEEAVGWSGNAAQLQEERDATVHSSQAKIKIVV
jgi:hypothetical protein